MLNENKELQDNWLHEARLKSNSIKWTTKGLEKHEEDHQEDQNNEIEEEEEEVDKNTTITEL